MTKKSKQNKNNISYTTAHHLASVLMYLMSEVIITIKAVD